MKYPTLKVLPTSRELLDVFKGYNHNLRIESGEFYEMENLSSDDFPILAPRKKRGVYASPGVPQGMIAKDKLCYVDGSDIVLKDGDKEERVHLGLTMDGDPKKMVSMGAYVIVMPDKKYVNTKNLSDFGDIEASVKTSGEVSFSLCKVDGVAYENVAIQSVAPENPENMALWMDTSSTPHTLKQYSATSAMWSAIATTYIKISSAGIGRAFSSSDGVTISGIKDEALADLNASTVIMAKGDDYIVVRGILDRVTTQSDPITVERRMPLMDFIIESGNRLWGCRYGEALNGEIVNEIYASKLGDFKNWSCFQGISTDSYAATVGTDGPFTGAVTHLGYPLFFKENCLHKVYGNYPANFQIQTTTLRGVQSGCDRSLSILNEVLYYKSRSGVCAYDGSLPVEISSALGNVSYHNAAAGAFGNKYYISMADEYEAYHLFVYDTMKGMWHREDGTQAIDFCAYRGDLYFIDYASKQIKSVKGNGAVDVKPIQWFAISGVIGTDSPDKKYISRMDVRMKLEVGTRVSFYAEYDSSGYYEYIFTMTGKNIESFSVPIRPRRCDHLRLRIVGTGEAKIFSICKTIEWGSSQ
jgi:hypothetical protein